MAAKNSEEKPAAEKARFSFDSEIRSKYGVFCGIDEAGRGPLAGDVYAAAVILPEGVFIEGINDSKKLSEKKREQLFDEITAKAAAWSVGIATVQEIDELNILNAAFLAMKRAVEVLSIKPGYSLVDGNKMPDVGVKGECIIGGDGISASVGAASIIAKVSRDRYMKKIAEEYPEYGFDKHKGYGTKLHYEKIKELGVLPVHRVTFLKKMH
ncbi:MAG: ribonuclease HII [Oscillospiraceae bacterium]|nr:ribonuclease HII [Oscillospiraceae bacterium]MDY2848497.1 ribonuclease HII [Oscillospiraceae bacterium]